MVSTVLRDPVLDSTKVYEAFLEPEGDLVVVNA